VATAAVLVIVLAAGYLLFWQGRLQSRETSTWLPASVIASLPAGFSEEILFRATFAADELPDSDAEGVFYRVTLPPGTSLPYLSGMACLCADAAANTGVGAEVVQSGAFGVRLEAPLFLQRGGFSAQQQEIPAGEDVTLDAGDVAIYHDYAATAEIRNAGSDPAVVIGAAIMDLDVDGEGESGHLPGLPPEVTGEMLANTLTSDWVAFPPGPVTLTLRRVTLPAGTTLPPYELVGMEAIRVEAGEIGWRFQRPGETRPHGALVYRGAGGTAPFVTARPDLQRFIVTSGKELAVLYVLTIEPAGLWSNPLTP
jgi:hypothetical protein